MGGDSIILGMRDVWGSQVPFVLFRADRRRHLYLVGQTGTGKSTATRNLAIQDILNGNGVAYFDPHGDDALNLLDHIPRARIEDVVYFDPSDPKYSVAFNPLACVPSERRHLVASGIVSAFKSIFPDFFGPRMEYIFYAAVAALLDCENVSLLSLPRMLTEDRYRRQIVKQVKDPMVRKFWEKEFEPHDKKTKAEMVSPILNKVGPLLMAPQLRNILGQVKSRIDARHMMDNGKIFIANLSKGLIGEEGANLLGSFLVTQFQLAAMSRADIQESARRDFYLYVDEFQSFVSDSFASILSEARKYRLSLTISHQYLAQIKRKILDAVLGNVGSIIAFRVGHQDAEALEMAFGKTYAASAFTSLNDGEVYAKLLENGRDIEPFRGRTLPPQEPIRSWRDTIVQRSREKYATTREKIEGRISRWLKSPRR